MALLKSDELPDAITNPSIKRTTRCLIDSMTRPNEASGARWDEIDWDEKVWTIPTERMKKEERHHIPLTKQMLTLLEVMRPISSHQDFIFPSDSPLKRPVTAKRQT